MVFEYCLTIKKNIIMKNLFERVYNYLSYVLFGGEGSANY